MSEVREIERGIVVVTECMIREDEGGEEEGRGEEKKKGRS
jgi:hypothetical protein